jgi:hypothetical protein
MTEYLPLSKTNKGLPVEGFPDAVKRSLPERALYGPLSALASGFLSIRSDANGDRER